MVAITWPEYPKELNLPCSTSKWSIYTRQALDVRKDPALASLLTLGVSEVVPWPCSGLLKTMGVLASMVLSLTPVLLDPLSCAGAWEGVVSAERHREGPGAKVPLEQPSFPPWDENICCRIFAPGYWKGMQRSIIGSLKCVTINKDRGLLSDHSPCICYLLNQSAWLLDMPLMCSRLVDCSLASAHWRILSALWSLDDFEPPGLIM